MPLVTYCKLCRCWDQNKAGFSAWVQNRYCKNHFRNWKVNHSASTIYNLRFCWPYLLISNFLVFLTKHKLSIECSRLNLIRQIISKKAWMLKSILFHRRYQINSRWCISNQLFMRKWSSFLHTFLLYARLSSLYVFKEFSCCTWALTGVKDNI